MLAPFPWQELYIHRRRVYTWAIISRRRNLGTILFHWYWWHFKLRGLSHTNLGYDKIHRSRQDLRCFEVDSPQLDIRLPRRMLRQIQKQHNSTLLSIFLCTVPLFCPHVLWCYNRPHMLWHNVCTSLIWLEDKSLLFTLLYKCIHQISLYTLLSSPFALLFTHVK